MKNKFKFASVAVLAMALLIPASRADQAAIPAGPSGISEKVRHELVMLPFYSVFDDLNYEVTGDMVTLTGQVTHPTLKSDAAAVVKRIPGVVAVVNQIEVLPLSTRDDQLRRAVYLTLFNSNSPLFRYGLGADPSIHIIVKNGHVRLMGAVSHESDKQTATLYVQQLFGVFSVTNDLMVGKVA
ncbi:MAG: BON domain-containing protein [Acidobacteria bacterium]|nr:BON domain-containing protein [Acidobacteriota bacterium]